jgi:NAD(P)-dependent dehydrogenase (short-subunit alcohol dehydrogenase family)
MRRAADTNEIADALLFLLSDEARYITAEVVTIDGGWLAFGGIVEPVGI